MNFLFMTFRLYLQKKYPIFVGIFLASLSKMHTGCPGEQFVGKLFLKKYETLQFFPILSENVSDFWQESFGRFVKNAVQGNNLRRKNYFFWKIYRFFLVDFGLRAKLFENFDGNISIRLSNLHLTFQGKSLRKKAIENVDSYSIP